MKLCVIAICAQVPAEDTKSVKYLGDRVKDACCHPTCVL